MFLIFSFANAYGAEIKFKTNSSDQSSALTTSSFKNQVSAGTEFIASVNSVNKVYAGKSGLKFGTSSAAGDFTITLADAAQLKNPTITIASAKYKSESTSFEVYLNGATSPNATITAGATSNNSFTFSGIITKIQIKSKGKRAYLSSITMEGEEGGSDLTPTSLAWSAETAIATIGADNTFPTLITTPTDLTGITYASSNTDIATIATDGTITLVASGVTTIMASFAGDDTHKAAADAKYTLTVVNLNAPEYQLFTGNLQAGEYVVYYNKVAMKAAVSSNRLGYEAVNPIEDVIQTDNATIIWKIEQNDGYWTLYNTSAGKYAAGNGTKNQAALVSSVSDAALWTVTVSNGKYEFVNKKNADASVNKNLRYNEGYGFACYGTSTGGALSLYKKADDADAISAPTISGADEFIESTEVTISAEDGLKVYYTLDGTDPTNASTEYTAPFELTATTTVKAVAYDGENASDIISKTFKKLQVLTCEEAADLCAETESADKYVIRGYVTNIEYAYDAGYNNISFWMADTKNGGEVFEAYRAQPIADADKAVKVGDYVEVIGNIVLYGTTPETTQGGTYTIIPAPVVNHTITISANPAEAGTVTGGGEYEETDEITVKAVANDGYDFVNWTENDVEVSTEANYSFAVLADRNLVANFKKSVVTHDFYAEGVTVSEGGWSINLLGSWNEQAFTVMLWQDNTQGFGTYAADAETGYTATLGVKELTPTAPGYYTDMQDGTFTFQGTMTDGTDIYEVFLKGALASSTGTGELEAKNEVYFTYEDGEWMIEAFADDQTWGLMLAVSAETDPETGENLVYGQYVTDIEAGITEEVAGTCQLYFDDFSGCYVFKGGLATASGNIYPTLYASSLTLMTNDLVTGPSWVGEFAGVDYYKVLMMAADYSWELDLHARNCTGANGTYTIDVVDEAEGAYSTFMGSTIVTGELTIEDGMYEANVTTVDSEGNPVMSISVLAWAAAAEEYDIVITDATVTDNTSGYNIDLTGEWEGHDIKVEVCDELTAETILANFFIDGGIANDGDQAEGTVEATVNEGVVTITGTFECLGSGAVYNVTISGTLPVVEPEVIAYELNGGELPTATVPTQDSLIAAFKDGYNAYFGVSVATTRAIDNFLYAGAAVNDPKCDVSLFMKDDASPWKWLGDYVLAVTNAQIEAGTLSTLKELATELMWRQSLTGFFLQQAKLDSNYKGNADFTEAGKPENWGAAYEAAHEVVLPTEPVAEDYVLPTPVKEGYTFVGWYDNAEGTGEPYKVIPAGWAGTLYAIWKQGTTTALENIAVEGKAVKAIINGQLIIIKNGVQYNAQGQVIK